MREFEMCIDCHHWHMEKKENNKMVMVCTAAPNDGCKCKEFIPRKFRSKYA